MSSKSSRAARAASRINRRPHDPVASAASIAAASKRPADKLKASAPKRLSEAEQLADAVVEQSSIENLFRVVLEMDYTQDRVEELFNTLLRSRHYDSSKCTQPKDQLDLEVDASQPRYVQLAQLFGRCEELHSELKQQLDELGEHTEPRAAHQTLQLVNSRLYDLKHQIEHVVESYAEAGDWCKPRMETLRQRSHLLASKPYLHASFEERRSIAARLRPGMAPATLIQEGETLVQPMPLSLESPARVPLKLMRDVQPPNAYLCVVASDDTPISANGYGYASAVLILSDSAAEIPLGKPIGGTAFVGPAMYRARIASLHHRLVSPQLLNRRSLSRDELGADQDYPQQDKLWVRTSEHHAVYVNGRLLELLRMGRVPADFDLALDYVRRTIITPLADPVVYELDSIVARNIAATTPTI